MTRSSHFLQMRPHAGASVGNFPEFADNIAEMRARGAMMRAVAVENGTKRSRSGERGARGEDSTEPYSAA